MILKLVNMATDPSCYKLIDNINEINYRVENGRMILDVQYKSANRGLDSETFELNGKRAYLMNDSGKTIETWYGG